MASHYGSSTPGVRACFESLDFLATAKGGIAQAPTPVMPSRSISLDTVIEATEKLQLCALKARAPGGNQLIDFSYRRLERQLAVFLGPQPSQED
jgi:hypothetical protein